MAVDDDKTPVLQPCLACHARRGKDVDTGTQYVRVDCRWCTMGAMDQDQLLRYCQHYGIRPKI